MWTTNNFKEYELLDTSDGEKLERWKDIILIRPDPQVIWKSARRHPDWKNYNARYIRSSKGGGNWEIRNLSNDKAENGWVETRNGLSFLVKPTGFKHPGVFPEQAVNWDFIYDKISSAVKTGGREVSVLNLFAYTGIATLSAAKAGAKVCHVDASKGIVSWAKQNAELSGLKDAPIRYIVDDCKKFLEREIRRGHKYDAVIMDPPSYGRGPSGEIWKLEDGIDELIGLVTEVISDDPLFVLVNSYTTGLSASTVGYMLNLHIVSRFGGRVSCDEIGIPVTQTKSALPAGSSARWEK